MTLETTGSGTFDVDGADVEGDTSLTTDGYTEVDAATAGGATAVTMLNSEATMEVTLPDGTFSSANPVTFSIERLPGGGVETVDGEMVTHLETYAFDFAIPTLNSAATLNFEIDLVALAEPDRLSLLDLLHDERGADAGRARRCAGRRAATVRRLLRRRRSADACVVVSGWTRPGWCSTRRQHGPIDPAAGGPGRPLLHLQLVAVGLAGDYNLDSIVDAADYIVWRDTRRHAGRVRHVASES